MIRGAWLAALLATACGAATAPPPATPSDEPAAPSDEPPAADPGRAIFDRLEQRLLDASHIELTAQVAATGHVTAELEGTLLIEDARVLLGFEGSFEGESVQLALSADAAVMTGGNGRLSFEHERPSALEEGLLIGITRMGILHNLAVLASGNPPQGTFGSVREWVQVYDVREVDDHLEFGIEVAGKPVANAELWLDAATGLPTRREQTVRFPAGTMTVVESYETFSAR